MVKKEQRFANSFPRESKIESNIPAGMGQARPHLTIVSLDKDRVHLARLHLGSELNIIR